MATKQVHPMDFTVNISVNWTQWKELIVAEDHGRRSVGDGGGRVPPTFQLGGDHIGNVPPTFLLKKWKISCVLSPSNLHSLSACVIDTGVYK